MKREQKIRKHNDAVVRYSTGSIIRFVAGDGGRKRRGFGVKEGFLI
jgi:hypothetical protein